MTSDASSAPPEPSDADLLQSGCRYALALSHHPQDAEDLLQEAWMHLFRKYGTVESRAVLFTTIRNLFLDQCRRRKVVQFDSLDAGHLYDKTPQMGEEPGINGDLDELLARLQPAEREVLFLHYHQGHTAEEIGTLTDRPRNTVLSLMRRAIQKLRDSNAPDSPTNSAII
jgi:RNA polymerase sigma factor (sigma-70 family)